ncbi:Methylase/methyltransferase [groundwater metagenome]|uniref:Methylase/methyltransferase n=1 Tax=groundwater metagenome TaxID=717931 RepID=A0A098EE99_9ZZZZ
MKEKIKTIGLAHYFHPKRYSIFINPYFIARYTLLREIKIFSNKFSGRSKRILDVGCGIKPYEFLFKNSEYIGIDIEGGGHREEYKKVDKYFDGKNIPFQNDYFDLVICTQVIEHTLEYEYLLKEIHRVLKKGGILLLTAPFVWNEHEVPHDFFRFTQYAHLNILKKLNFETEYIKPSCGFFSTIGQLLSAFFIENLGTKNLIIKFLVSFLICAPIQIFFIFWDKVFRNKWLTLDYFVIARRL